jgi:hypothetical protein
MDDIAKDVLKIAKDLVGAKSWDDLPDWVRNADVEELMKGYQSGNISDDDMMLIQSMDKFKYDDIAYIYSGGNRISKEDAKKIIINEFEQSAYNILNKVKKQLKSKNLSEFGNATKFEMGSTPHGDMRVVLAPSSNARKLMTKMAGPFEVSGRSSVDDILARVGIMGTGQRKGEDATFDLPFYTKKDFRQKLVKFFKSNENKIYNSIMHQANLSLGQWLGKRVADVVERLSKKYLDGYVSQEYTDSPNQRVLDTTSDSDLDKFVNEFNKAFKGLYDVEIIPIKEGRRELKFNYPKIFR